MISIAAVSAGAAGTTTTIDPIVSLLIGALGATLLTIVAGFIASARANKNEHSKWVREQRADAYRAYKRAVERIPAVPKSRADFEVQPGDLSDALADLSLVGPESVHELAMTDAATQLVFCEAIFDEPGGSPKVDAARAAMHSAAAAFLAAAKKELGVLD